MWGSRSRHANRQSKRQYDHTFDSVKENIRKKSKMLKESTPKQIQQIDDEIKELTQRKKLCVGRAQIRNFYSLQNQIEKKQIRRKFLSEDKHIEKFVELVQPLINTNETDSQLRKQQRHALFLNLFYKDKAAPCFIDRDICSTCNTELVTFARESINMCPKCGESEKFIYCNSDFLQNDDTKVNQYERGPLYRKYLMQFHQDVPDPPDDVIDIVFKHLSKVHIMLKSKVKPTPISQILRQENLQKWTSMSVRISKMINGEPIVKLSTVIIDRLVLRFNKITRAFSRTKKKDRKKIMNFEFLTKKFLLMENLPELSEWYSLHKTRDVLSSADRRLERCCKSMKDDVLNWDTTRSC